MDSSIFNGGCCLLGLIQRFPHQDVFLNGSVENPGLLRNVGKRPVGPEGALQEVHLEEAGTTRGQCCSTQRRVEREKVEKNCQPAPGCWKSGMFFHCRRFHRHRAGAPSGSSTQTGIKAQHRLGREPPGPAHLLQLEGDVSQGWQSGPCLVRPGLAARFGPRQRCVFHHDG